MHQFIPLHSRIHRLNDFSSDENITCYIKRDDELSSGISGTKCRKYSSLLPFLQQNNFKHIYVIGSTHSNNVLAAMQLLREYGFNITALLLKPHHPPLQGNFKLTNLFLDEQDIIWLDRTNWPEVESLANKLAHENIDKSFVLTEGASVKEAIQGAKTLSADIIKNELDHKLKFDHIFLDAGTGFSALSCIKYLEEIKHQAQCHVLLLADDKATFKQKNKQWANASLQNTTCFIPSNAKSFGSINKTLKTFIQQFAYKNGVLLDPIYSAKLFFETQKYIEDNNLNGNILVVHSGGVLTLPNFQI